METKGANKKMRISKDAVASCINTLKFQLLYASISNNKQHKGKRQVYFKVKSSPKPWMSHQHKGKGLF